MGRRANTKYVYVRSNLREEIDYERTHTQTDTQTDRRNFNFISIDFEQMYLLKILAAGSECSKMIPLSLTLELLWMFHSHPCKRC